jgi:hypothetical protein
LPVWPRHGTTRQVSFGGKPRSSLAEKLGSSNAPQQQGGCGAAPPPSAAAGPPAAPAAPRARFPGLLKRFVRSLPCHDPPAIAALGKNSAGGPLLQATLRAAAADP